jgi:hypothetical protein
LKGLKTTIATALAVGLLAGSAVGVAAQDEEPAGSTYFTGTIARDGNLVSEPSETIVDGILEGRGIVFEGESLEATDARMTGTLSRALNGNVHKVSDFEDVVLESAAWRIENEGGSWSGQGSALIHGGAEISDDDATDLDTILLTGEGIYEGLTAYVIADWTEDPVVIEGAVIVGEAPPVPELLSASEPAAE